MSKDESTEPLSASQASRVRDAAAYARITVIHLGEVLAETGATLNALEQVGEVLDDTHAALSEVEEVLNDCLSAKGRSILRQPYRVLAELRHVRTRLRKYTSR